MTDLAPAKSALETLRAATHARRIFYHDIEIGDGLRTRFEEDYAEVPTLRGTDAWSRRMLDWLNAQTEPGFAGRTVLDVGCADGLYSLHAARLGAKRVLGIERNRYNYDHACFVRDAAGLHNVSFVHGAIEQALPDETFDDVFALSLVYHLVSPLAVLHELRQRCRGRLFATCPIDLDTTDAEPFARLDRYQTGGHGFWAFNESFVRQMFETAGFGLADVQVTARHEESGNPANLFMVAKPLACAPHHVFAATLDQDFPPSYARRRAALRQLWPELSKRFTRPVAVFGAGRHTGWMLEQVGDLPGPKVECVLDDRALPGQKIGDLPVRRPEPVDAQRFAAILISSWFQHDAIERRCRELFGKAMETVRLGCGQDM